MDGHWELEGETTDVSPRNEYRAVRLAAFHPWRLHPLIALATEIMESAPNNPFVGLEAEWAAAKTVPAFRMLGNGTNHLHFVSLDSGSCYFRQGVDERLPAMGPRMRNLRTAIATYKEVHPWSQAGNSLVVINAPKNGVAKGSFEALKTSTGVNPYMLWLVDSNVVGADRSSEKPEGTHFKVVQG